MADARAYLPYWLWPGDDRPTHEVDEDIAEELRLHLDLLAEENERRGMAPGTARHEATKCFGDLASIERRCRRIRVGEKIMLQRVQAAALVALLFAVVFLAIRQWNTDAATAQFMDQTTAFLTKIERDIAGLGAADPGPAGGPGEAKASREVLDKQREVYERRLKSLQRHFFTLSEDRSRLDAEIASVQQAADTDAVRIAEHNTRAVAASEAKLKFAQSNQQRVAELHSEGIETQAALERAENRVVAAEQALSAHKLSATARQQRSKQTAALRIEELRKQSRTLDAQIREAEAALAATELELMRIKASVSTPAASTPAPPRGDVGPAGAMMGGGMGAYLDPLPRVDGGR
ncbi:MAG: permease prefix domain 1-containing protein [Planctomycetota bacterium]